VGKSAEHDVVDECILHQGITSDGIMVIGEFSVDQQISVVLTKMRRVLLVIDELDNLVVQPFGRHMDIFAHDFFIFEVFHTQRYIRIGSGIVIFFDFVILLPILDGVASPAPRAVAKSAALTSTRHDIPQFLCVFLVDRLINAVEVVSTGGDDNGRDVVRFVGHCFDSLGKVGWGGQMP